MPNRLKYRTNTNGSYFTGFFPTAIAYTTQATYGAFILNSVEGEIGVYTGTTGSTESTWTRVTAAWGSGAGAINAGQSFLIVEKILGSNGTVSLRQTPSIRFEDVDVRNRTLYSTPVRQVSYVGYNGNAGTTMGLPTFVANANNGSGYAIRFNAFDRSSLNQPYSNFGLSYNNTNSSINWLEALLAARDVYNTYTNPRLNVAPLADLELIVNVSDTSAMTVSSGNVVFTRGSALVTATGHNLTAGSYIRVDSAATTAVAPNSASVYKVVNVNANDFTLDTPYIGQISTFGTVSGTETVLNGNVGNAVRTFVIANVTDYGFKMTSIDFGSFWDISLPTDSILANATVSLGTQMQEGFGDPEILQVIENQAINNATNQNNQNWAWQKVLGNTKSYVNSSLAYNAIDLSATQLTTGGSGINPAKFTVNARIFTPATAASIGVGFTALTVSSIAITTGLVTTSAAHGLAIGDAIVFSALAGGTGVTANQIYYVIGVASTTTFTFATSIAGAAVVPSVAYTGTTVSKVTGLQNRLSLATLSPHAALTLAFTGAAN